MNLKETKKLEINRVLFFILVPEAGIEPARYRYRWILSPVRLPVSPLGQRNNYNKLLSSCNYSVSKSFVTSLARIIPAAEGTKGLLPGECLPSTLLSNGSMIS